MKTKITEENFKAYENVRISGITNMFSINKVSELSSLNKKQIMIIMKNYSKLKENFIFSIKKELIQISGIVDVVCRDSGILEIYYIDPFKKERIQRDVLSFLNKKSLNDCFISAYFIQVKERINLK